MILVNDGAAKRPSILVNYSKQKGYIKETSINKTAFGDLASKSGSFCSPNDVNVTLNDALAVCSSLDFDSLDSLEESFRSNSKEVPVAEPFNFRSFRRTKSSNTLTSCALKQGLPRQGLPGFRRCNTDTPTPSKPIGQKQDPSEDDGSVKTSVQGNGNTRKRPSLLVDYSKQKAPLKDVKVATGLFGVSSLLGESSWRNLKDVNATISDAFAVCSSHFDSLAHLEERSRMEDMAEPSSQRLPRKDRSSKAKLNFRKEKEGVAAAAVPGITRSSTDTIALMKLSLRRRQAVQRSKSFDGIKAPSRDHLHTIQTAVPLAQREVGVPAGNDTSSANDRVTPRRTKRGALRSLEPSRSASPGARETREVVRTNSKLGDCRCANRRTKTIAEEASSLQLRRTKSVDHCTPQVGSASSRTRRLLRTSDTRCAGISQPDSHPFNESLSSESSRSRRTPLRTKSLGCSRSDIENVSAMLRRGFRGASSTRTADEGESMKEDSISIASRRRNRRRRRSGTAECADSIASSRRGLGRTNSSRSFKSVMHSSVSSLTASDAFAGDCQANLFVTGSRIRRHESCSPANSFTKPRRQKSMNHLLAAELSKDTAPCVPRRKSCTGLTGKLPNKSASLDKAPTLPCSRRHSCSNGDSLLDIPLDASCSVSSVFTFNSSFSSSSFDDSNSSFDSSVTSFASSIPETPCNTNCSVVPTRALGGSAKNIDSGKSPEDCLQGLLKGLKYAPTPDQYFLKNEATCLNQFSQKLAQAVRGQDLAKVQELLDSGASFDACNSRGEPLVHLACRQHNAKLLHFLIKKTNATLRVRDGMGRSPLHEMALNGRSKDGAFFPALKLILEKEPELLFGKDNQGFLPLQCVPKGNWNEWQRFLESNKVWIRCKVQYIGFARSRNQLKKTLELAEAVCSAQ